MRAFAITLVLTGTLWAQAVDPSTLKGKVLLGYQGWFRCPAGGASGTNWSHWTSSGAPAAASIVIDMYPDLREFEPGEACTVPGMTVGGSPARLFSAGNSKTVARHFRWMRDYRLDGVLVQRFVSDLPGNYSSGDAVLKNILAAAAQYGRTFAIEYDISGANPAGVIAALQKDWNYLVNELGVTAHPLYLHEGGKPVVSVWGIGLNDSKHPPNDIPSALQLIDWFRSTANVIYIGGTPSGWRTSSNDAFSDPAWSAVYKSMDVIQPWTVGRYGTLAEADAWASNRIRPDLAATNANNQLYMPVIFPGFSWYNLNREKPQNQIPRNGGSFLWRQAINARQSGAQMLKIAMFDEVNESTAMFKLAARRSDAPDQGYWLTLDADGLMLPSDWYLRLAGEIARIFRGQSAASAAVPANPGPPWQDGMSVVSAASFRAGTQAAEALATVKGTGLEAQSIDVIDSTGFARPATILYASPAQVNFQIPAGTAAGGAAVVIAAADGTVTYAGATIGAVGPGLFTADGSGSGLAAGYVYVKHADGSVTSALTSAPIALAPGDEAVLELYGTGIRGRSPAGVVACMVGGIAAQVVFAGPQGQFPGLDQVNVALPPVIAGAGEVTVNLTVDGLAANPISLIVR